jgi:hypothetical protein
MLNKLAHTIINHTGFFSKEKPPTRSVKVGEVGNLTFKKDRVEGFFILLTLLTVFSNTAFIQHLITCALNSQ